MLLQSFIQVSVGNFLASKFQDDNFREFRHFILYGQPDTFILGSSIISLESRRKLVIYIVKLTSFK